MLADEFGKLVRFLFIRVIFSILFYSQSEKIEKFFVEKSMTRQTEFVYRKEKIFLFKIPDVRLVESRDVAS